MPSHKKLLPKKTAILLSLVILMFCSVRSCGNTGKWGGTYSSNAVHFKPVTEDKAGLSIVHPGGS